jgi:hypothetical protein
MKTVMSSPNPIRVLNGKVIVWLVTGSYGQEPRRVEVLIYRFHLNHLLQTPETSAMAVGHQIGRLNR